MDESTNIDVQKKKRLVLLVAALAAAGVAAAGVAVFVGGMGSMSNLEETADAFLAEAAQQNYEAAYGRMCGAYRGSHTMEEFKAAVRENAYLRGGGQTSFNEVTSIKNTYRAAGVLTSAVGNVDAQFGFVEEGEALRITGILLGGMPAL